MSDLLTLLNKVVGIVKDDSAKLVNPDDYELKIAEALNTYSKHRPDTDVVDVTGNGGHDYDLPTGWSEGFSEIKSIEYPIGDIPATLLDPDTYEIYQNTTKKQVRLLNNSPAAADTFRITFTIPRTITTIIATDEDAFCRLVAALCLEDLANAHTQTGDSVIGADSVNYRSKGSEFSARAKKLITLYKNHMGIKGDDITPAASVIVDLDLKYPAGGERLTHPRWAREKR